jgi:hypothetical protein
VKVHTLKVNNDGEIGNAEWVVTFDVNGQVQTWTNRNVNDGDPPYQIGLSFSVPLNSSVPALTVRVGGIEEDGGIFDPHDPLPSIAKTYTASDTWGMGFHTESASDDEFDYTVSYEIQCAQFTSQALVSRPELIAMVRGRAAKHPSAAMRKRLESASDSEILTLYLRKLRKAGWAIRDLSGDMLLLEGTAVQGQPLRHFRAAGAAPASPSGP